jgi:hypothetical protein
VTKVLLSLDEALLRLVDRKARARRLSRSAYFSELARMDVARDSEAVGTTLRRLDRLFARTESRGDATAIVRAERDKR